MRYIGGGPYHAEICPECGSVMWNGRCENPKCDYHWKPKKDDDDEGTDNKRTAIELVADNAYFGDSKPNTSGDGTQAKDAYDYSNMDFEPNGEYQGSMPGGVSGDFAPDF